MFVHSAGWSHAQLLAWSRTGESRHKIGKRQMRKDYTTFIESKKKKGKGLGRMVTTEYEKYHIPWTV